MSNQNFNDMISNILLWVEEVTGVVYRIETIRCHVPSDPQEGIRFNITTNMQPVPARSPFSMSYTHTGLQITGSLERVDGPSDMTDNMYVGLIENGTARVIKDTTGKTYITCKVLNQIDHGVFDLNPSGVSSEFVFRNGTLINVQ